jgi:hypothetical protein
MMILYVSLFIGFFIAGVTAFFFAWGTKDEISAADPEYSRRLYRSSTSRLFSNQWPIRPYVLFTEEPPARIAGTVKTLRVMYAVVLTFFGLLMACFVFLALAANTT